MSKTVMPKIIFEVVEYLDKAVFRKKSSEKDCKLNIVRVV